METLLSVIIAIASLVIIAIVLQMESEQAGLGTLDGSVESDMWGSNRGSSKKEMMNRAVIITTIIFAIALIVLAAID